MKKEGEYYDRRTEIETHRYFQLFTEDLNHLKGDIKMYVGDRDTFNDVFCQACGHIAGRETLDTNGLCEDCRPLSKIAETNDRFRRAAMKGIKSTDGKAVRTQGIAALGSLTNLFLQAQIAAFDAFTETNDPHGEHDFGSIQLDGCPKVFWKIDYYSDASMDSGADDKLNAYRVLVIMLADEY